DEAKADDAATAASAAAEAALGLSRSARAEVQRRLTLIGFDTKGVDGAFGANSRSAIGRWQSAGGREQTGFLDAAQHAALIEQSGKAYAAWLAARPKPRPVSAARAPAPSTAPDLSNLPPGPPDSYRYGRPSYGRYPSGPTAAAVTGPRPD